MSDAGYSMLGAGTWGWPREMLWGRMWEGGSCLGTHVRINDFKIKKKKREVIPMHTHTQHTHTHTVYVYIYIYPYVWVKWSKSHLVVSDSLLPHGLYSPWNSPGHNTGVGSLSLLQGIFPTQGLNPGLLHCRQILYPWATREVQEYWSGYPTLLQWIFPTQESNQGLLHCRWILYQLSYQDGKGNNWEYTVHCFIYSFIMNVWRRKGKSMTSLPLMYHSLVLAKGLVP